MEITPEQLAEMLTSQQAITERLDQVSPLLQTLSETGSVAVKAVQEEQQQLAQLMNTIIQRVNQLAQGITETQAVMLGDIERLRSLQAEQERINQERQAVLDQAMDLATTLAEIIESLAQPVEQQTQEA